MKKGVLIICLMLILSINSIIQLNLALDFPTYPSKLYGKVINKDSIAIPGIEVKIEYLDQFGEMKKVMTKTMTYTEDVNESIKYIGFFSVMIENIEKDTLISIKVEDKEIKVVANPGTEIKVKDIIIDQDIGFFENLLDKINNIFKNKEDLEQKEDKNNQEEVTIDKNNETDNENHSNKDTEDQKLDENINNHSLEELSKDINDDSIETIENITLNNNDSLNEDDINHENDKGSIYNPEDNKEFKDKDNIYNETDIKKQTSKTVEEPTLAEALDEYGFFGGFLEFIKITFHAIVRFFNIIFGYIGDMIVKIIRFFYDIIYFTIVRIKSRGFYYGTWVIVILFLLVIIKYLENLYKSYQELKRIHPENKINKTIQEAKQKYDY